AGVFKHQVGDLGSWSALDANRPDQPTALPRLDYAGDVTRFTHNWGAGALVPIVGGELLPNAATGTGEVATRVLDNPHPDGDYFAG
ncbi:hypothetical protein ABTK47_19635, partial [Acinetobacter baumannii]